MDSPESLAPIRVVASRFHLSLSTLHYWERRGLISARRRSGQRCYDADQRHRIALIRCWQATGLLSLDEIADVLAGDTDSTDWRDTVAGRIGTIDAQVRRLHTARGYLTHLLSCPRDNPRRDCPELRREVAETETTTPEDH